MLPGGFFVLGIFIINPKNVFEDQQLVRKAKTILIDIKHTFSANELLQGECQAYDNGEKLILFYSSSSNNIACKSFNVTGDGASLKNVDFKLQDKAAEWKLLETYFELDDLFPLEKKDENTYDVEDNLNRSVAYIGEQLQKGVIYLNGEGHNVDLALEKVIKEDIAQVHIYMPCVSTYIGNAVH
jgi:hypothetical protein